MTETWALAALWIGLALFAAVASIWLRVATALELAAKHGAELYVLSVAVGHPAGQIIYDADRHGVDLIVVGHRGRSNLARFLLGSVSKQAVQHAGHPVVVVR